MKSKQPYIQFKRSVDRICAGIGIAVLSPIFLMLIVAIRLDSPGPVFFRQKRVGIHKTHFYILKFRTMRTDTPKDIPTHMLHNPEQYITRVGKFLRKTSLDELPQIVNILKGEMSIIGPRPALWNQYDLIRERDRYGANDFLPGLTGLAQIKGRDELELQVKAELDGIYVSNIGLWMDIRCFVGTIISVLKRDGVVEGGTGRLQQEKEKKYLILTNHSYMLWQFRRELIENLMEKGQVVLGMPFVGREQEFADMGCRCVEVPIDRRGMNPFTDYFQYRSYVKLLKKEQPDLVITYSIKPNIYGGYACIKQGIPYAVNVQGLGTAFQKKGLDQIVTMMYKIALQKARVVFFENQSNAEEFMQRNIVNRDKIKVLNGAGVNLIHFPYRPYPDEKSGIHILYVGRIMKEKGMDELFQAAIRLKKNMGDRIVFDLVGFFEDEYKEKVERLEKDGIIAFHGFQEDPGPYYAMAHCVVLPSYHEGMSNVLLEAAATGRPLITNDIPGCREAVEDGKNGYLTIAGSEEDLLKKLEMFLALSKKERADMGQWGRKYMRIKFNKSDIVEATVSALFERETLFPVDEKDMGV